MIDYLSSALAFGLPGGIEWVVIGLIALLIFGRRLPQIMRGLGSSAREFREGLEGKPDEVKHPVGEKS